MPPTWVTRAGSGSQPEEVEKRALYGYSAAIIMTA